MDYQSLYRRYRPQRFADVRGQAHVVRALQNAVRDGRVGHAYLLSGPRGTGKTTLARILAKVLNCENPLDGEPCGTCASCKSIESGTSFDLHELDAASNNKVDDMRDLLSKVALGTPGRSKVYLLDEVHMLSAGAENALLKTLEEPPDHVVFVLATTEPHKVVATIRSRTQHLVLNLLGATEMAEHVRWVAADAGLSIDDDVVDHVVRAGGGSVRDTLSALDQVVAAGGVAHDDSTVRDLLSALAARDPGQAMAVVAEATRIGRDPRVIGESLIDSLRLVFLTAMQVELPQATDAQRAQAAEFAQQLSPAALTRALETVGSALVDMRQAPDPRIDLEVALVKLTRTTTGNSAAEVDIAPLLQRIERLEQALATSGGAAPVAAGPRTASKTAPAPPPRRGGPADEARQRLATTGRAKPPPATPADAPRAATATPAAAEAADPPTAASAALEAPGPDDPALAGDAAPDEVVSPTAGATAPRPDASLPASPFDLAQLWTTSVLGALSPGARARFSPAQVSAADTDSVTLALPNETHRIRCEERRAEVEAALTAAAGRPIAVVLVAASSDSAAPGGTPSAPAPEADDSIDLNELVDAPAQGSLVDQVLAAFPGAEIVEG